VQLRRVTGHRFWVPAVVAVLLALTGCQADWMTIRGGSNSAAVSSTETAITPQTVQQLSQRWSLASGSIVAPPAVTGAPLVSAGMAVFATNGFAGPDSQHGPVADIDARDLHTGKLVWRRTFVRRVSVLALTTDRVIVSGDLVYSDYPGEPAGPVLLGLSLKTGAPVWQQVAPSRQVSGWEGPATEGGGRLYLNSPFGLQALDPETGRNYWMACPGRICPLGMDDEYGTAYADERLYLSGFGTGAGGVLDARTGQLLWNYQPRSPNPGSWQQPVVSGGRVFLRGYESGPPGPLDGAVAAFPAAGCGQSMCRPLWQVAVDDVLTGQPTLSGNTLVVGGAYGTVVALDATTGRILWRGQTTGPADYASSAGGVTYIQSTNGLTAFATAGCGHASCPPLSRISSAKMIPGSPPVVSDGVLLYADVEGLHALSPRP
jgi:outer membrane protein assembly factor BamB